MYNEIRSKTDMLKINPIKTIALATMLTAGTITSSCCEKNNMKETQQTEARNTLTTDKFEKNDIKQILETDGMLRVLLVLGTVCSIFGISKVVINKMDDSIPEGSHHYGDGNHMGGD